MGEKLNVLLEPDNRVDKFTVCVEKDHTVVGQLGERRPWKVRKDDFLIPQK